MARVYSTASASLLSFGQSLVDIATAVDTGTILKQETLAITLNGQTSFSISDLPNGNKILLSLNGQLLTDGVDYTITDTNITILNSDLETSDILIVSYLA